MNAPQGVYDDGPRHGTAVMWWLVPVALVIALLLVGLVTVTSLRGTGDGEDAADAGQAPVARNLPVYWTVKRGDTYSEISQKTGLTVDQLETFNPRIDPTTISPGQRVKLRLHLPKRKPKPLGPKYWTVRSGQSFGSIAAQTGRPIDTLMSLNKKLKPELLQAGDRVRLRR